MRLQQSFLFCAFLFIWPGAVFSQAPFYQGKTITLIIGLSPGGTGDLRIKATIPYLSKYIPGNPNIVAQYVAGAGGRTAANQMYKLVKPDGLTIGNMGASMVTNAVLGAAGVEYDVNKFIYLGSPDSIVHWLFATRKEAGFNTIEKLRSSSVNPSAIRSTSRADFLSGS
jgi:tripartite-type tricarboxylate transporter receptor subunit TctC